MSQVEMERCVHAPHRGAFFRNWLQDPFKVASVTPSGRMLAKRMAAGIAPGFVVLELGAGTGTLTDAIKAEGVHDSDLFLVEQNKQFVEILRQRFPRTTVLQMDAAEVEQALPELVGRVDCIVSGLPILWFNRNTKRAILRSAFHMLQPFGFFRQLTYFSRPPIGNALLKELQLTATLDGLAPINFPPAFVYRFERTDAR